MSSGEINREALREIYTAVSQWCFIKKAGTTDHFIKRVWQSWSQYYGVFHRTNNL